MSRTETNKILINRIPIQNKSDFSNPNYVSPSDILPVPKALPRKGFTQQKNLLLLLRHQEKNALP